MNIAWRTAAVLVVVSLVGHAAPAWAQSGAGWLADRSRTEGSGIRVGDFELHPGVGVELGYDSNIFFENSDTLDSLILRVTPHLNISTLGAQRRGEGDRAGSPPMVNFEAGLSGSYYAFFNNQTQNNVSIDGNFKLVINPQGNVSFTLYDQFGRTIRPFTERAGEPINFARIRNEVGTSFNFSSDGGVFSGSLGYAFAFDVFEGNTFNYGNSFNHRIEAGTSWKFLPNTAVLYDFQLNIGTFINDGAASAVARPDSYRLRSRIGLNGAITRKLSLSVFLGYTAGFFDGTGFAIEEYESVMGQAEVRWKLSERTQLTAGYSGGFFPTFAGVFARRDGLYATFSTTVGGVVLLGVNASGYRVDFGPQLDAAGNPLGAGGEVDRVDGLLQAGIFAEYRLTQWLGLNANVSYMANFTGFEYTRDLGGMVIPDPAEFQKFEAWLGVRAFY